MSVIARALKFVAATLRHDTDWEWHETLRGDPVMRRRVDGSYQIRQMTPDEMEEYLKARVGW